MKERIKKLIPKRFYEYLKVRKKYFELKKIYKYEAKRFIKWYSKHQIADDLQQLKARLILHAHRLEKGLSHIEFRNGFGKGPCYDLKQAMDHYNEKDFCKNEMEYNLALSVLKEYTKKHEQTGLPDFFLRFFEVYLSEIENCKSTIGGIEIVTKSSKSNNKDLDYKALFNNRVSVREWDSSKVDFKKVREAIELSMKTPTVCNRQAQKIRVISNALLIEKVLKLQGGFSGYKIPPILALITTDCRNFVHLGERSQMYIDGGIYSMSFLNGLEYVGLGACALNAMFNLEDDKNMRKLLNVPEYETFIMFIAIGNFLDETPYCKSVRKSAEEISNFIN